MKLKILLITLIVLSGSAAGAWGDLLQQKGKVAVIDLSGDITPSSSGFSSDQITPEKVRTLTSRAKNQNADAIIYEINSGGGAVVASKEVMRSIDAADIPTVCRIRDVGASGAYLASLGCDRIVMDEVSLTGSIGVTASYMEFSGLMDKLGIEYVNISAGEYKETGSRFRNTTGEDRKNLREKTDRVHRHFIELVDENRNITDEDLEKATTGEVFLGDEAIELGLVDELGGRRTSVRVAENMTGQELQVFQLKDSPDLGLMELFLPKVSVNSILDINTLNSPLRSTF